MTGGATRLNSKLRNRLREFELMVRMVGELKKARIGNVMLIAEVVDQRLVRTLLAGARCPPHRAL
jgi:hypothetical protein